MNDIISVVMISFRLVARLEDRGTIVQAAPTAIDSPNSASRPSHAETPPRWGATPVDQRRPEQVLPVIAELPEVGAKHDDQRRPRSAASGAASTALSCQVPWLDAVLPMLE